MVVVKVVDAVAPLRRPLIGGEQTFHFIGEDIAWRHRVAIDQNRQRTVRHPAVRLKTELLRRCNQVSFNSGRRGFVDSYAGGEDTGGEVSAVDRPHPCEMRGVLSGVGTRGCP